MTLVEVLAHALTWSWAALVFGIAVRSSSSAERALEELERIAEDDHA